MNRVTLGYIIIAVSTLVSCNNSFDYYGAVKEEIKKADRYDELFLDVSFGMPKDSFFDLCWRLNNEGKVSQGPKNRSVEYLIPELKEEQITMQFYPNFVNDQVAEMPLLFTHTKWAPWNKELLSSKLILKIKQLMIDWYGGEMHLVRDKKGLPGYVGVKGNRRITISILDSQYVKAVISDLSAMDNPLDSLSFGQ